MKTCLAVAFAALGLTGSALAADVAPRSFTKSLLAPTSI
jgi:hypothetical protein